MLCISGRVLLKTDGSDKDFKNKQQLGFSLYEYVTKRKKKSRFKHLNIIQSQFLCYSPACNNYAN